MKTKPATKPRKATRPKTKAATPAATRPTINAELVDDLFSETIANLMALQAVWDRISLKEELQ